jgi:CheY-like chemotaxis protein
MPKVMIIDDAPALRNSFSRVLRKEGFEPIAMQDGLAALGSAGSHPPDLIVLDLNMPHMDGLEVLKRLRSNLLWRSVPVVVFSGAPRASSPTMRAEDLGVAAVLEKGTTTVEELMGHVRQLTAGPFALGGRL